MRKLVKRFLEIGLLLALVVLPAGADIREMELDVKGIT